MKTYILLWYGWEIKKVTNEELFELRTQAIGRGEDILCSKGCGLLECCCDYFLKHW